MQTNPNTSTVLQGSIMSPTLSCRPFNKRTLISPTTSGGGPKEGPYQGPSPACGKVVPECALFLACLERCGSCFGTTRSPDVHDSSSKTCSHVFKQENGLNCAKAWDFPLIKKQHDACHGLWPSHAFRSTRVPCHRDSSLATGSNQPCTRSSPTGSLAQQGKPTIKLCSQHKFSKF